MGGQGSRMTRLFFCTDVHGSEVCFRKFLSAGKVYEASVVIMGGDCTGKMVIPLVHDGNGTYRCRWSGGDVEVKSESELAELETQIKNNGLYPVRMTPEERARLESEPDLVGEMFTRVMGETLEGWLALAEERLRDSGVRVIFTPGNDDDVDVDEILGRSTFVEACEGKVVTIGDRYEMLSLGWS